LVEEWAYWYNYFSDKQKFPSHKMTKRQRLDMAFANAKTSTGADQILKEQLAGKTLDLTIEPVPSHLLNDFWSLQMDAARRFCDERGMSRFMGYARRFYFDPDPVVLEDHIFKREYRRRQIAPTLIIDEAEFRLRMRRKTFTSYLAAAMATRGVIQFNIPIRYGVKEFVQTVGSFEQAEPFTNLERPGDTDKDIQFLIIEMYRQVRDQYFSQDANVHATSIPPRWFVDEDDSIRKPLSVLLVEFHEKQVVLREEVQSYYSIEFLSRAGLL
jgi:hypothetical protein